MRAFRVVPISLQNVRISSGSYILRKRAHFCAEDAVMLPINFSTFPTSPPNFLPTGPFLKSKLKSQCRKKPSITGPEIFP